MLAIFIILYLFLFQNDVKLALQTGPAQGNCGSWILAFSVLPSPFWLFFLCPISFLFLPCFSSFSSLLPPTPFPQNPNFHQVFKNFSAFLQEAFGFWMELRRQCSGNKLLAFILELLCRDENSIQGLWGGLLSGYSTPRGALPSPSTLDGGPPEARDCVLFTLESPEPSSKLVLREG